MDAALQTVLTVLQNQQFQTQQYGNVRVAKSNVEVPTNLTCCKTVPQDGVYYCNIVYPRDTIYCYATPITTAYRLSKEIL